MKNRDYKIFAPHNYYHVYNRGNGKMNIFKDDQDFSIFLKRLKVILSLPEQGASLYTRMPLASQARMKPLAPGAFSIMSYCLMPNHFHLLIRQNSEVPISKLMSKLCTSYSIYFNKKYIRVGGIFQDQFKSIVIDSDNYLLWLSAYIHQNPVVAGLVTDLKNYPYSSYLEYINLRTKEIVDTGLVSMTGNSSKLYEQFVLQSFEKIKERKDLVNLFLE